jgi:hypothetical protein
LAIPASVADAADLDTTAERVRAEPVKKPTLEQTEKIEPPFTRLAKPRLRDGSQPQKRIDETTIRVYRTALRNSAGEGATPRSAVDHYRHGRALPAVGHDPAAQQDQKVAGAVPAAPCPHLVQVAPGYEDGM